MLKSCFEIYKGFESYVYYVGDRRLSSGKADDDAPATTTIFPFEVDHQIICPFDAIHNLLLHS